MSITQTQYCLLQWGPAQALGAEKSVQLLGASLCLSKRPFSLVQT